MIIFRYLTKEVLSSVIAISFVLLFIFISNQIIHFFNISAAGHLSGRLIGYALLFELPNLLSALLPLSLFLGIIITYGKLYENSEMIVIKSSGISQRKIANHTLKISFFMGILVGALSIYIGPYFNNYANLLVKRGSLSPLELLSEGRFQSMEDGRFIFYAGSISKNHDHLKDIFIFQNVEGENKIRIIAAKKADQITIDNQNKQKFLSFQNGGRYDIDNREKKVQKMQFSQYLMNISLASNNGNYVPEKPLDIFKKPFSSKKLADLEWKLSMPVMTIVLAIMAVPLSRVNRRSRYRFAKLIPALLLYMIYGNFMFLFKDWIIDEKIPLYFGIWWLHLGMLLIGFILAKLDKVISH